VAVVPASHTFATTAATSSEANSFIRDPITFALNPPRAELRQIVAQTVTSSAATPVTFTAEDIDADVDGVGGHDNVTNPSRYTARYAGWYQVSGAIGYAANATGRRLTWWAVNGTAVNSSQTAGPATASLDCQVTARTKQIFLNVGDYVELVAWQESGGPLATLAGGSTGCGMSIRWVSN